MGQDKVNVSAVVIAYNDEPNIRACLESIRWAQEVVVLDSYSTDKTGDISREFTSKVYQHPFAGFGELRNKAVSYASHDWIFSLDTDERATPDVRDEIERLLSSPTDAVAYFVPRRNHFLGREIRHCGWYPDYRQPQFFHKRHMKYREDLVHEGFDVDGKIGIFRSAVLQFPFRNIDHYLNKMERYSTLMAERMMREGKRFQLHQLVSHPLYSFLKTYCLRLGFLDGPQGLMIAGLQSFYTFAKYAKLWEMTRQPSKLCCFL